MSDKPGKTKEEQEEALLIMLLDGSLEKLLECLIDRTRERDEPADISQERSKGPLTDRSKVTYAIPEDPPAGSVNAERRGTYTPPPPYLVGLRSQKPRRGSDPLSRTPPRGKVTSVPTL